MNGQFPKIGVGVLVWKDGKVLLGKRKGIAGHGNYASPGGHLEFGESIEECAAREVMEEAGIEIENIRLVDFGNYLFSDEGKDTVRHYLNIEVTADWKSGEPENREPDKLEGWDWYTPENLPSPLFFGTKSGIEHTGERNMYLGTIHL